MVSIITKGFEYSLDIFELLRVFFPNEEIIQINDIRSYKEDYLVELNLENNKCITNLYYNNSLINSYEENFEEININREVDKTIRVGIKKSLYNCLEKGLNTHLSWGILTGIRPGKIVDELFEKGTNEENIFRILTKEYKLSKDNTNLLIDISKRQSKFIYPINKNKYSLYISIPFCPSRCIYCSFPSLPIKRFNTQVSSYIDTLIYELKGISRIMKGKELNSVYIGGGTPTSIPIDNLEKIIQTVYQEFGQDIKEFTVEAGRPDTINEEVLKTLKENNINRISINPQTMNDKTLKIIGRKHNSEDIINTYNMAKDIGIPIINMDLIIGLPGEGLNEVKNTLNIIEKLNPENLTVHTMAVKRGSKYKENINEFNKKDIDIIQSMIDETKSFARRMSLNPYYLYRQKQILGNFENIGYAKEGTECIYNISIMEEKETIIAAGMGSVSKIFYPEENRIERIPNFRDLKEYINRIDELLKKKQYYS